jgi:hypothetical protein
MQRWLRLASARKSERKPVKVIDESAVVRCLAGDGVIREEVWEDASGNAVRFNLTFINFHLFVGDNGRVLGYDTAHGHLHRHFAGAIEPIEPAPYVKIYRRFFREVEQLKKRERL